LILPLIPLRKRSIESQLADDSRHFVEKMGFKE